MNSLKLVVHTTGGALGLDRVVEVSAGTAVVSERGEVRTTTLAPEQLSRIDRAAQQLTAVSSDAIDPVADVVDGGRSEIAISGDGASTSLVVPAGADAPDAVWDLLEVLDEVCDGA